MNQRHEHRSRLAAHAAASALGSGAITAQDLAALAGQAADVAVREWSELPVTLAADILDLLAKVRARRPVVLLTNATNRLAADIEGPGVGLAFNEIVNTSEIGSPKPERAAFDAAAAAFGSALGQTVRPEMIAFVDDTAGHVVAAEVIGWTGLVFVDATALHGFLNGCGFLT